MDDVVAGAIVGAAAQAVIDKLFSLLSHKFDQVEEFEYDMEKLKDNFEWIQATLDDPGMQHITSRVVKQWLRQLEDVSDEAYFALDEFHYHLLRERRNNMEMEAQTSLMRRAKSVSSSSYSNDPQQVLGRKIKDINERLKSLLNLESKYVGIRQMILGSVNDSPGVGAGTSARRETDSYTLDPVFVGREKELSEIVEMLANIPTQRVLSILPIVGMGGLGKTTLAREFYHHERVSARFPTGIWLHVSTTFDPITLFKKILTSLTWEEKVEVEDREVVLGKLQRALANRTFLFVLDDLWNQDREMWDDFINPLSRICSSKGNGIIVTTRSSEVGSIVGTLPTYELQGLSEEDCWSIIKEKSYGEREMPLEFQILGRNIAKRCQGLPLASNVVGGLLCHKSKDDWVSIQQNWLFDFDEDENIILKILKLSFHHLPSPSLKKCFAHCSFFERGGLIRRKEMIELWMAEGFLQSSDMENVGNDYCDLLLQYSLLEVVDRDEDDNVELCSMHDLVYDLAEYVLNGIVNPRYIRWKCNGDASSRIPVKIAIHCHALSYEGAIFDITLSNFQRLHSLTLLGYDIKELPDSIRELINLRYFNISQTSIEHLPDSNGELYHLQTLRICDSRLRSFSPVKKVPSTLKYLFNLRHLHVSRDTKLPPHVGMLTCLRTLPYFRVHDEDDHRIEELESLKNLQGELEIDDLDKVQGLEESEKANLSQKSRIIRLVLRWNRLWEERTGGEINDEDVLTGLQPHPNLKKLRIHGFSGARFPSWTLKMAVCLGGLWVGLNNLMDITLDGCEECEEIPTLGHLPRLKSVFLRGLRNVEFLGSSFYGIDRCSSNTEICKEAINVFPALECLEVVDMPNLREWAEVNIPSAGQAQEARDIKVFPCLTYLRIINCEQLANICRITSTSLTTLEFEGLDELVYLPDCIFQNNQNLSVLEIGNCPKLRELPDGLQTLTSLRELAIMECNNLKSMPYFRIRSL